MKRRRTYSPHEWTPAEQVLFLLALTGLALAIASAILLRTVTPAW